MFIYLYVLDCFFFSDFSLSLSFQERGGKRVLDRQLGASCRAVSAEAPLPVGAGQVVSPESGIHLHNYY